MRITDWDVAYQNSAFIPDADRIAAGWARDTAAFRAGHPPQVIRYGSGQRQVIDVFRPDHEERGLTVFVHGGYWQMLSGPEVSHLAAGPLAHGQVVAVPSYTLAPAATIAEIVTEMARALTLLAQEVDGPIRLVGHSAGGQLVTRLVCIGALPDAVAERVAHVVSIAGVHDLRPLLRTAMRETLHLTPETAAAESPALLQPRPGVCLTAMVGAQERPEFIRQTDLLANIWTGLGADCQAIHLPGHNHFSMLEELADPDGAITQAVLAATSD